MYRMPKQTKKKWSLKLKIYAKFMYVVTFLTCLIFTTFCKFHGSIPTQGELFTVKTQHPFKMELTKHFIFGAFLQ